LKLRTKIIIAILYIVLAAVALLALFPWNHPVIGSDITLDQALGYLDTMEKSHQQILDDPHLLDGVNTKLMGDLAFHTEMVREYRAIRKLILTENRK
jgi:hypothetical protein